jgi:hypothetical protein
MRSTKFIWLKVAPIVILGAAAIWALWELYANRSETLTQKPAPVVATSHEQASAVTLTLEQRLQQAATESRLRELEARVTALASSAVPSAQGPQTGLPAELDLVAMRAEHQRKHDDAVARHWTEPEDRGWSRTATQHLRNELDGVAKTSGFTVVRADCRAESCVAVTEWPNYAAAGNGWGKVVSYPFGMPCGVEVMLKEPTDPADRYQTTVLFTCDPNDRSSM